MRGRKGGGVRLAFGVNGARVGEGVGSLSSRFRVLSPKIHKHR